MKRHKVNLALIIFIIFMFGCNKSSLDYKNASVKETLKQKNIQNINNIYFEDVTNGKIPSNLDNSIKILKANRGYIINEYDEEYYITIFSGKKSSEGDSIKVLSIQETEGDTNITIGETSSNKGDIVTQVVTYPYVVIKIKEINPNVIIKTTKDEVLEEILTQDQMH